MTQNLGYNNDFTDADAQILCQYATLLNYSQNQYPLHPCGWVSGQGVCRIPVPAPEFSEHLRTRHGVVGSDKASVMCCWEGCFMELKKESLTRHVNERHLEQRFMCPHCSEQFTRQYTLQNHVSRKHSAST